MAGDRRGRRKKQEATRARDEFWSTQERREVGHGLGQRSARIQGNVVGAHVGDHDRTRAVLQLLGELRHALGNLVEREVVHADVERHTASIILAFLRPLDGRVAGLGELESCRNAHGRNGAQVSTTQPPSHLQPLHMERARGWARNLPESSSASSSSLSTRPQLGFLRRSLLVQWARPPMAFGVVDGMSGLDAVPMRWREREVSEDSPKATRPRRKAARGRKAKPGAPVAGTASSERTSKRKRELTGAQRRLILDGGYF